MAEGFIELTFEHKVVYVNPSAAAILGRPEEQILSENFISFFQDADQALLTDALQEVRHTSPVTIGEKVPFQINSIFLMATFILVESQSSKTIISILQDITARKKIETELEQYRNNLESIVHARTTELTNKLTISLRPAKHDNETTPRQQVITSNFVELAVEDTGFGMTPGILAKIFDPYFTTKEAGEGTGMGLAVVHGIVTGHGGSIFAESQLNKGSRFVVQFPVASVDVKEELGEDIEMFTGTEHILLVDDEPAILMIMAQTLSKLGYKTTSAKNGPEALEIYLQNKDSIDIVLTDITMPGMTGLRLAKMLLTTNPELPIILCTGKQLSPTLSDERLHELGVKSLLNKPFSLATLSTSIRTALVDVKR
nr:response regulator [Desulfobulbaceae bacterium]